MKKGGFTLIELLVVIAIIAILAGILFPVFNAARAKARQASCTSNEKQVMLAWLQYTQDYDDINPIVGFFDTDYGGDAPPLPLYGTNAYSDAPGSFDCFSLESDSHYPGGANDPSQPLGANSSYNEYNVPLWSQLPNGADGCNPFPSLLYPYLKSIDIYNCPSRIGGTPGSGLDGGSPTPEYDGMPSSILSYATNWYTAGVPTSKCQQPSATYALWDSNYGIFQGAWGDWTSIQPRHPYGSVNSQGAWDIGGGVNMGFLDGHVKWESIAYLAANPQGEMPGFVTHWTAYTGAACCTGSQVDVAPDGTFTNAANPGPTPDVPGADGNSEWDEAMITSGCMSWAGAGPGGGGGPLGMTDCSERSGL